MLIVALIILSVLDLLTTAIGLKRGYSEGMLTTRWLIERLGVVPGIVVTKLLFIGGPVACAALFWPAWLSVTLVVACIVTGAAVLWNVGTLARAF